MLGKHDMYQQSGLIDDAHKVDGSLAHCSEIRLVINLFMFICHKHV